MWQGQEYYVVPGEVFYRGFYQNSIGERMQMRCDRAESLPGLGVRGDCANLYFWMGRKDAKDLTAGVSAGAGDSY